eukprot:PhM_4_TR3207/c0_g1_i1/m.49358/K04043/dnaK, HSPA9; molecular chaperone DnaK
MAYRRSLNPVKKSCCTKLLCVQRRMQSSSSSPGPGASGGPKKPQIPGLPEGWPEDMPPMPESLKMPPGMGSDKQFNTEALYTTNDRQPDTTTGKLTPRERIGNLDSMLDKEVLRNKERSEAMSARFAVEEDTSPMDGVCIGIDLGTSNSCISYYDEETGRPQIIPNKSGSWVFPTVISFQKDHKIRLFGEAARVASKTNPFTALSSGKRLIGRRFGELSRVVGQHERTNKLIFSSTGEPSVDVGGRVYSVVHITGMFLRHLKNSAEESLGKSVPQCVVSVPAYFTPQQKVATEDAALIAGFDVLEVIDEPTAACLTYSLLGEKDRNDTDESVKHYIVIDLGGGTLDCAVMRYERSNDTLSVIGTHGDPLLGGNDWDNVLMHHFAQNFRRVHGIDLEANKHAAGEIKVLQLEAEKAKIWLTHNDVYTSHMGTFHFDEKKRDCVPLSIRLDRRQYDILTRGLIDRCIRNLHTTLQKVSLKPRDIHDVLLVGGMTRDPPFQKGISDFFGRPPVSSSSCPPDYAVAMGAAIRAAMLNKKLPDVQTKIDFAVQPTTRMGKLVFAVGQMLGVRTKGLGTAVRWRGKVAGLTEDEIKRYAKEIVEHEAQCSRRSELDNIEEQADQALQRLSRISEFRQGEIDQQMKLLQEQIKFWQYMVHQFHNHEESLMRTVNELNALLDDLDGMSAGVNKDAIDDTGRVKLDPSKVLRRKAADKLPADKKTHDNFVEKGVSDPKSRAQVPIMEETRTSMFNTRMQDMATFEPPPPPGEDRSVHAAAKLLADNNDKLASERKQFEAGRAGARADLNRAPREDSEGGDNVGDMRATLDAFRREYRQEGEEAAKK